MLHVDFETRSSAELGGTKSVGLYNYATDPSTSVLMLAWCFDDEPVEVWQPHLGNMPDRLVEGLKNPKIELAAFNSSFERYIFKHKLAIDLPISRFQDPQASARYLSLPGSLDMVGEILGLPASMAKDKEGSRLLDLFSKPHKKKKKRGEEPEWIFYDWNSHPDDWQQLVEYCRRDVVAEREVMRREKLLGVWPLPPLERRIWELDQKINDRGIPVDLKFVQMALKLADREKKEAIEKQNQLTGLENANSNTQLLEWVRKEGYDRTTLAKGAVDGQLKYNDKLTPLCRQVLEARKAASSTSYKKLSAILRQVSADHRLRNQFIYMGSSRCGRWSGNAVQLHNMARPTKMFENEKNVIRARELIKAGDYEQIQKEFGSVLLTVKSTIRTAFVAEEGKRFNVCDLNAIETRGGAWVSGCQNLLDVFDKVKYPPNGRDPYLDMAVKFTGIPYDSLERDLHSSDPDIKAKAKEMRQWGKPGVLGPIYRLGGGQMGKDKNGDPIKMGMWGYAEGYGIEMTQKEAHDVVRIFRESYKAIPEMWYALEAAIKDVLDPSAVRVKRKLGPDGCIEISKFVFDCHGNDRTILRIQLPSGRFLHYMDAHVQSTKMPWKSRDEFGEDTLDVYKPTLCYAGLDQVTKQWRGDITSHGGKVFENIVQGLARDVLAEKLLKFESSDLFLVAHVHDEGITETEDSPFTPGLDEMNIIMSEPVLWAPTLPLGSDGFETTWYHK